MKSNQFTHYLHAFLSLLYLVLLFCFPRLYLFAWSLDAMVRIKEVNAAIRKVFCSHEPAFYFPFSSPCCQEKATHVQTASALTHTPTDTPGLVAGNAVLPTEPEGQGLCTTLA